MNRCGGWKDAWNQNYCFANERIDIYSNFCGVGIILLLLIVYLFVGKGRSEGKQDTADANERYQAGIYTKDITLGESTASLEVALDTDHIKSVKIVPLDESITTMYPLMEPAVKSVSNQLAAGVAPEEVELTKESKYTQQIIVDAVEEILEEQGASNQTVK